MKRFLLGMLLMAILVVSSEAKGAWIISDPYTGTQPDYFSVSLGGQAAVSSLPFTLANSQCTASLKPWSCCTGAGAGTCAGSMLRYDVSSLAVGNYNITVQACSNTTPTVSGGVHLRYKFQLWREDTWYGPDGNGTQWYSRKWTVKR